MQEPRDCQTILGDICQEGYISGAQDNHQYWMIETSLEATVMNNWVSLSDNGASAQNFDIWKKKKS